MKQRIRLNESQFNNLVKQLVTETVNKILSETWKLTDYGVVDYDENGVAPMPSREDFPDRWFMYDRPLANYAAATKYYIPNNKFSDNGEDGYLRPSDWFVKQGSDSSYKPEKSWPDSEGYHNIDADMKDMYDKEKRYNRDNLKRAIDAADKRPLHRKNSPNREIMGI